MRKYPIGLTSLVGTLGGIIVGFVFYGVAGTVFIGLFGFAVGSHIDIQEYYTKRKYREREQSTTGQEDAPISLTGSMFSIQDTLKQIDAEFEQLDEIFSDEGVCPTPELQRDDGSCNCKYDLACNLGDPKPRREAHEHVKKALDRIMAWM